MLTIVHYYSSKKLSIICFGVLRNLNMIPSNLKIEMHGFTGLFPVFAQTTSCDFTKLRDMIAEIWNFELLGKQSTFLKSSQLFCKIIIQTRLKTTFMYLIRMIKRLKYIFSFKRDNLQNSTINYNC